MPASEEIRVKLLEKDYAGEMTDKGFYLDPHQTATPEGFTDLLDRRKAMGVAQKALDALAIEVPPSQEKPVTPETLADPELAGDAVSEAPQMSDSSNFREALMMSESSGDQEAAVKIADGRTFSGLFQFGQARLEDYKRATGEDFSQEEYLGSTDLQNKIFDWHIGDIDKAIDRLGESAQDFDRDGLRAVAHLGGIKGMRKFVQGNYNPSDELGTSLQDYYDKFSGISSLTGRAVPDAQGKAPDLPEVITTELPPQGGPINATPPGYGAAPTGLFDNIGMTAPEGEDSAFEPTRSFAHEGDLFMAVMNDDVADGTWFEMDGKIQQFTDASKDRMLSAIAQKANVMPDAPSLEEAPSADKEGSGIVTLEQSGLELHGSELWRLKQRGGSGETPVFGSWEEVQVQVDKGTLPEGGAIIVNGKVYTWEPEDAS